VYRPITSMASVKYVGFASLLIGISLFAPEPFEGPFMLSVFSLFTFGGSLNLLGVGARSALQGQPRQIALYSFCAAGLQTLVTDVQHPLGVLRRRSSVTLLFPLGCRDSFCGRNHCEWGCCAGGLVAGPTVAEGAADGPQPALCHNPGRAPHPHCSHAGSQRSGRGLCRVY
jgi:hypothetical protein